MQRASFLPSWDRTKPKLNSSMAAAKPASRALDKVFGWTVGSAALIHECSATVPTRYGRETYWPSSLDKECEKAARILKSFCADGFLARDEAQQSRSTNSTSAPDSPAITKKKIPPRIIQNAVGLAIFSCMRSGLWMAGSGGSGVLIARKADGTWSPPSGLLLHTAAIGFAIGVDIYDCVLVINSVEALELFTRPSLTLGADVNLLVGPLSSAAAPAATSNHEIGWNHFNNTVLSYLKARGQHQVVQLDGSLIRERGNENQRFYTSDVNVLDVLAGNINKNIPELRPLFEVIKAAEGRTDYDTALLEALSQQPAPGDAVIETRSASPMGPLSPALTSPFGIPDREDPDPFGVIALEMAGLEIREAGSRTRPTSSQFEYNPSPTSPVFQRLNRQSVETYTSRSNRGSFMSSKTHATAMTDAFTQTDLASTPATTISHANSEDGHDCVPEKLSPVMEPDDIDYTKIDSSMIVHLSSPLASGWPLSEDIVASNEAISGDKHEDTTDSGINLHDKLRSTRAGMVGAGVGNSDKDVEYAQDVDDENDEEDDEELIIFELSTAAQPTRTTILSSQVTKVIQAKGALVTIPKRVAPPVPAKSAARTSRSSYSEFGDVSLLSGPVRSSLQSTSLRADDMPLRNPLRNSTLSTSSRLEDFMAVNRGNTPEMGETIMAAEQSFHGSHQNNSSSVYTIIDQSWSGDSAQSMADSRILEAASSEQLSDYEPQMLRADEADTLHRELNQERSQSETTSSLGH